MTSRDGAGESTPATLELESRGIPHRLFRHPGPVASLQQAADERGQSPEQVIRSIVFRVGEGEFVMVLMAGEQQVSWRSLRRYLGQSRLTIARGHVATSALARHPVGLTDYQHIDQRRRFIDRLYDVHESSRDVTDACGKNRREIRIIFQSPL